MEPDKIAVPTVVFIQLNGASREQFIDVIEKVFQTQTGEKYMVNERFLEDRGVVYLKTSLRMYHLLLGLNEDGSRRVQLIDDPNFVAPMQPIEEAIAEAKRDFVSESWADTDDDIEEAVRANYRPRQIEVRLPPLLQVPAYKPQSYLTIQRTFIDPVDITIFNRSILCVTVLDPDQKSAQTVKFNVPAATLKSYFADFSTNSEFPKIKKQRVRLRLVKEGPQVDVEAYFIHFDSATQDAERSMIMLHAAKLVFRHKEFPMKVQFCTNKMYQQLSSVKFM